MDFRDLAGLLRSAMLEWFGVDCRILVRQTRPWTGAMAVTTVKGSWGPGTLESREGLENGRV